MTTNELGQLISDTALAIIKQNSEYITEWHLKEFKSAVNENGKITFEEATSRILTSYLRTSIELSVAATINVLKALGVEIPNLPSE